MSTTLPPSPRPPRAALKIVALAALGIMLVIPISMLHGLVSERMLRLETTRTEISSTWGGAQTLAGPLLLVPVQVVERAPAPALVVQETRREMWASFLPRTMDWTADLEPEIRRRGLFETIVFRARLRGRADFRNLDPQALASGIDGEIAAVDWSRARLVVGLTDNRGLEAGVRVALGGSPVDITPGALGGDGPWGRGFGASLGALGDGPELGALPEVTLDLELRGSGRLAFLPVGETTSVRVEAPWAAPSFTGAFLPRDKALGPDGFGADWVVPWTARSTPQTRLGSPDEHGLELASAAFGVDLVLPADSYQKVDRAAKYGVLFLALTFAAFLLGEIGAPRPLHPVHYALVGAALVLFYVLLLALAEHLGFPAAYAVATLAVAGLVGLYTSALLPRGRSLGLTLLLGGLYGYLYVTLAAEDFALLLGASGLFAALAAVMWTTRRIDWTSLAPLERQESREPAEEAPA